MTAGKDFRGQGSNQGPTIGAKPAFATIADDTGLDDQILNDETFEVLEDRCRRFLVQGNDPRVMDGQVSGLGPFVGPRSFPTGCGWLFCRGLQATGSDHGRGLQPLEPSDFVFELLDPLLLGGVSSPSGISGKVIDVVGFYQLVSQFARCY